MNNLSENQLNVLKAINKNGKTYTGDFDVCFKFGLKTRSFKNTINSLVKRGLLIETKERFKSFSDTDGKFFNNSFVSVEISEAGIKAIQAEDQVEDVKKFAIIQKGEAIFSVAFTLQAAIQDVNDYFGNEIDDYNENSIDHFRNVNEGNLCWVHVSDRLINEINKGKVDLFEYDYKNEVLDVADFEEIQAEDQAENQAKDQAEAKPKALKESTVKRYDVHQLTRHLEKLQDHFLIAPFRIDTIIREYDSYTNSYLVYCQIHEMNRDFILDAIESTYRKLKIDWSWPNLQHGNYEEITC